MAAVTYEKLIVTPSEVLRARWADLGGRWYAEPVRAWMGKGEELWLGGESAATVLLVRHQRGRTFLVEPRHQAAFDADTDEERGQWVDRPESGDERGYRAFLQVDLAAFWRKILSDLRSPSERAAALARLASETLHIERDDDPSTESTTEEPTIEERGALVEGFDHVDPAALLVAAFDAGLDAQGKAYSDWYRVLDGVAAATLPERIPAALRSRLAALRDDR